MYVDFSYGPYGQKLTCPSVILGEAQALDLKGTGMVTIPELEVGCQQHPPFGEAAPAAERGWTTDTQLFQW